MVAERQHARYTTVQCFFFMFFWNTHGKLNTDTMDLWFVREKQETSATVWCFCWCLFPVPNCYCTALTGFITGGIFSPDLADMEAKYTTIWRQRFLIKLGMRDTHSAHVLVVVFFKHWHRLLHLARFRGQVPTQLGKIYNTAQSELKQMYVLPICEKCRSYWKQYKHECFTTS